MYMIYIYATFASGVASERRGGWKRMQQQSQREANAFFTATFEISCMQCNLGSSFCHSRIDTNVLNKHDDDAYDVNSST